VPIAFLFGLGIQGDPSAYIIGLVSLGVLTSLDLRGGFSKVGIGFAISFLASLYVIGHSVVGQGFWPLSFGDLSLLLVSLPTSIGVLIAGLLFLSRNTLQDDKGKRRCVRRAGRRSRVGVGSESRFSFVSRHSHDRFLHSTWPTREHCPNGSLPLP